MQREARKSFFLQKEQEFEGKTFSRRNEIGGIEKLSAESEATRKARSVFQTSEMETKPQSAELVNRRKRIGISRISTWEMWQGTGGMPIWME